MFIIIKTGLKLCWQIVIYTCVYLLSKYVQDRGKQKAEAGQIKRKLCGVGQEQASIRPTRLQTLHWGFPTVCHWRDCPTGRVWGISGYKTDLEDPRDKQLRHLVVVFPVTYQLWGWDVDNWQKQIREMWPITPDQHTPSTSPPLKIHTGIMSNPGTATKCLSRTFSRYQGHDLKPGSSFCELR